MYLIKLKPNHPTENFPIDHGKTIIGKKEPVLLKELPQFFEYIEKYFEVSNTDDKKKELIEEAKVIDKMVEETEPIKAKSTKGKKKSVKKK